MELLVIIGVVAVCFIMIYPILLGARVKALEKRMDFLARRLTDGSSQNNVVAPSSARADFAVSPLPPAPHSVQGDGDRYESAEPTESAFWAWLKQDTLVKVGATLLILAVAWFVTYAFANDWIGPVGRILLGLVFGAAVLAFGVKRIPNHGSQGAIFTVVGSTTIILTVTAAQYVYEMFPSKVALGIMFLVAVLVALVSLQYERSQLAYASLITALLAPFLINSHSGESVLLMLYLLLIVVGTLWVVWRLRAEKITLVALIGVILYTATVYNLDTGVALLFSFIFTGIFFITNIISLVRRYIEWVSPTHVITALLTGVYLISSIVASAPEEWVSTYMVFWCLVFAYGSYQVFLRTLNKIPFYIYAAVSAVLLGSATAVELSGALLTIMLTLEVLACVILMSYVRAGRKMINIASLLLVVPGLLTIDHMDSYSWSSGFLHADFFALLVFTGALIVAGLVRNALWEEDDKSLLERGQMVLYSIAGIYVAIILWLTLHSLFTTMVATMLALIIYSVVGLVLYVTGKTEGDPSIKKAGVVILTLVVIRLLFVDVWALEMTGRIITFLIIGLLFMSTAFLPKPDTTKTN